MLRKLVCLLGFSGLLIGLWFLVPRRMICNLRLNMYLRMKRKGDVIVRGQEQTGVGRHSVKSNKRNNTANVVFRDSNLMRVV